MNDFTVLQIIFVIGESADPIIGYLQIVAVALSFLPVSQSDVASLFHDNILTVSNPFTTHFALIVPYCVVNECFSPLLERRVKVEVVSVWFWELESKLLQLPEGPDRREVQVFLDFCLYSF